MFAGDIVERLENRFDIVEAYIEKTHTEEFELRNSKDFSKGLTEDAGCSIRVVKDNRSAFVYFSLKDDFDAERICDELDVSLKLSKPLDFEIINMESYKEKNIKEKPYTDREKIKEKIYLMDSVAKNFDKRIVDVKGSAVSVSFKEFEIANSYGMDIKDSVSYASASVSVLAKDKNSDVGWYSLDADNFNNINFEFAAQKAANMAVNKLYPTPVSTKKYSVIFANHVFEQILSHFFTAFDAYSVINHTTALEDKINKRIFSENITIKDAKTLKNRPNNTLCDYEGSKRKDTIVVENGILKNFLHNTYTSNKLKMTNTSNAKRGSWMSIPKVGPFNFYIEGDASTDRDTLLNKIDGVYVTEIMGLHMADSISGDFSFGVDGFLVHNGELVSYFKAATLADNFFDIMNRIIGLSNSMYFSSSFGTPDVAIADCTIGGENNG